MPRFEGGCHCGNVRLVFETPSAPEAPNVQVCGCGFCRRHGALGLADPEGRLKIAVEDPKRLIRYRFEHGTADYLICGDCGVYTAAVLADGQGAWGLVNANALDARADFGGLSEAPVRDRDDGQDSAEARAARRKAAWTPLTA